MNEKNMKTENCPLCKERLISKTGLGCLMCGMPIDYGDFCSMKCENIYEEIHKNDSLKGGELWLNKN